MTRYTIFGANGFVGREMVRHLGQQPDTEVRSVTRDSWPDHGGKLGHVIYTIGMTADFRTKPFDTVERHVTLLRKALRRYEFDSFLFLSSTRVYRGADSTREEEPLRMSPVDPDRLYDFSKLCGEALCLSLPGNVRVARLSNVFGVGASSSFTAQVIDEVVKHGTLHLRQGLSSKKDYIDVRDVCRALEYIAACGRYRIYNVASGINTSHKEITEIVEAATKVRATVQPDAPVAANAPISVERIASEIEWKPARLTDYLPAYFANLYV